MIVLTIGVVLFAAVHFVRRLAPGLRAALIGKLGEGPYKGIFTIDVVIAFALMIWGYQIADFIPVYDPPTWGVHLNNLAMILAVYLFGASAARTWIARTVRHPQLTAVIVWAVAHLLANGDMASLILFGGILVWAVVSIFLINASQPDWTPPEPRGIGAEIRLVVITLVVFAIIVFVHGYVLGVSPFPG